MTTSSEQALKEALHDVLAREGIADQRGFLSERLAKAALRVHPAPVSSEPAGGGEHGAATLRSALVQLHDAALAMDQPYAKKRERRAALDALIEACREARFALTFAASPAPAGDEREEAHLAAVVAMHRRELLAFGQYAAIVHPEDLPADYRPGMKLVERERAVEALAERYHARAPIDEAFEGSEEAEWSHALGVARRQARDDLAAVAARLSPDTAAANRTDEGGTGAG